nr:MAG TPA: hypothetical protein [Caudoviricetes sp.]
MENNYQTPFARVSEFESRPSTRTPSLPVIAQQHPLSDNARFNAIHNGNLSTKL